MRARASQREDLEFRLRTILPEQYQDSDEEVQPVSMGSAAIKYGTDGKVAWDDMWDSFCDLAMAGGPPHKGKLLEPATRAAIEAEPKRYRQAVAEIMRGIRLVTDLAVDVSPNKGWVRVVCNSKVMASWLLRAIVMENVSARAEGASLELPAGPDYRIEKEIKNVITVIAKTDHYWSGHIAKSQQRAIAKLFEEMEAATPLLQPPPDESTPDAAFHDKIASRIATATELHPANQNYAGWCGVHCPSVRSAIWMMRSLVASNVLSRREETTLFVPANPLADPSGHRAAQAVIDMYAFAAAKNVS